MMTLDQTLRRLPYQISSLINRFLRPREITIVDCITDGGEDVAVVAGPFLWRVEDVFELVAVLKLFVRQSL